MTTRTRRGLLLLVLAAGLGACEGTRAPGPTAPSTVQPPIPQPAPQPTPIGVQLAGTVSDAAWRRLAGARVEVVNGPQAGLSATVDAKGEFRLTGDFDATTQFRATRDGHVAATWPLPPSCAACRPNFWIHFYLESVAPHANIAGDYTLTFIADTACVALPDEARTRTYRATVTPASGSGDPANSWFNVAVTGGTFVEHRNSFMIGVAGDYLKTDVGDWGHGSPGLVEEIAPNTYLTLGGALATSVTDTATISGSFYGAVDRCELTSAWGSRYNCADDPRAPAQCLSQNHQIILTRR
jgi:hypothetical protein